MTHDREIDDQCGEDAHATSGDGDLVAAAMENDLSFEQAGEIREELLARSKTRIEAGQESIRDGVEDFAIAMERCNASQREVASYLGKSASWVSGMLRWRRQGYPATPFGPESKAARDRRKKQIQATEVPLQSPMVRAPTVVGVTTSTADTTNTPTVPTAAAVTEAVPNTAKVRNTKAATTREIKVTEPSASAPKGPSSTEAKNNLIYALNHWWPYIDDAGKAEVASLFFKLKGLRVS